MAEPETNGGVVPIHDGRFGDQFDDEISNRGLVQGLVGIGVITALAIIAMIFLWNYFLDDLAAKVPQPGPLVEEGLAQPPPAPLLQASPEEELIEMRREMSERVGGYGWVDEASGIVHVPVDRAIDQVLERGIAAPIEAPAPTGATATEPTDAITTEPTDATDGGTP